MLLNLVGRLQRKYLKNKSILQSYEFSKIDSIIVVSIYPLTSLFNQVSPHDHISAQYICRESYMCTVISVCDNSDILIFHSACSSTLHD